MSRCVAQLADAGKHLGDEDQREDRAGEDQYGVIDGEDAVADPHMPAKEHRGIDRDEPDAQFRRTETEGREPEDAAEVIVDEDVDADQVIADQREQRGIHPHMQGQAETAHDHQVAEGIDRVIEEIAVGRAFDPTMSREASVERIAEPVDDESERGEPEKRRVEATRHIAGEHEDGTADSDEGQVIRQHRHR